MESFRLRIQKVSLSLIALLLLLFSVLLYGGLWLILHRHVDADLLTIARTEAKEIELSTGQFRTLTREDHDHEEREHDRSEEDHELHELREAIRSSLIREPDGTVLWTGENVIGFSPLTPESLQEVRRGITVYETVHRSGNAPIRRILLPIRAGNQVRYILQTEHSLEFVNNTLMMLLAVLLGVSAVVLLAAWMGSRWIATQALTPVELFSSTASQISSHTLGTRVSLTAPYEEFQRLTSAFNSMLERLQHSFEAQRRFVADAAHELKTPLTAMKGHLEVILQRPRTADEYREAILTTLENTERLHRLTQSLLELAQLSGERQSRKWSPVNMKHLVQEVQSELHILFEDKGVTVHVQAESVPAILGDEVHIKRILINLLDNAIRHTPRGGTITIRVSKEANDILLSISDTGPGIAPEHVPHVFDRFYRVETARDRQSGGTGLGLALVKEIVDAHGGKIEVESEVGKGTVVTIHFPLPHETGGSSS